ncbi:hypothetical protein MIND_00863800 [Mycena indigotica]|uniref:F-box domain-containing protein n=1 Tax=Mycena indigotica TaxID=2126181 RepID=A0A8H6SHV3_9AGAR|nr:uncharacterized protein MIND_00863800 [Mycena indigotica]KAF7299152.1 hypothetical protein MIND_00863800 [Mycena indigotica]
MITHAGSPGQPRSDIEARITALDVTITEIQATLSALQLERSGLVSELEQLQVSPVSAPIQTLPPEVLSEIFQYFRPCHSSLRIESGPKETTHIPWFLGLVCQSWRQVAMGLPELWSVLDIYDAPKRTMDPWDDMGYDQPVGDKLIYLYENFEDELQRPPQEPTTEDDEGFDLESQVDFVKTCLQRSKTHGLSLRLRGINTASKFTLELLLQYSRHWVELILFTVSAAAFSQIRGRHFPRLRRLIFDKRRWGDTSDLSSLGSFLHAPATPRLTEMSLTGLTMSLADLVPIRFSDLEKYSEVNCHIHPAYRTTIFQQLVNLVSLSIRTESPFMWTEHIFFPNLRYASFAFNQQNEYETMNTPLTFEMPNLEDFSLDALRMYSLGSCVPQSSRRLRKLSVSLISVKVCQGDSEQVFALFPRLEDLSLWGSNYLMDSTLESLTPSPQRPYLLPRLETLRLSSTAFAHGQCKWTTLLEMVVGRFGPLATTAALSRLRSLEYVYDPKGYDNEVGKGLQTLQRQRGWDIRVRTGANEAYWTESGIQWLPHRVVS